MTFHIEGLDPALFRSLWGASEADLHKAGAVRMTADTCPGYPDRITLDDAPQGRDVILVNHLSQPADTPFRASHAIFVMEGEETAFNALDSLPPAMIRRPQSLRAFDAAGMMRSADLAEGETQLTTLIADMLDDPDIAEIHAHNARQGCFLARITRA